MGAWGSQTFENDTAIDWLADFVEVGELEMIQETLETAIEGDDEPVDVDVACEALAACEVLAHLNGKHGGEHSTTPELDAWIKGFRKKAPASLYKLAGKAVERVLDEESELRLLWEDAGDEGWLNGVKDLQARLKV
jgi:hypothetical protein